MIVSGISSRLRILTNYELDKCRLSALRSELESGVESTEAVVFRPSHPKFLIIANDSPQPKRQSQEERAYGKARIQSLRQRYAHHGAARSLGALHRPRVQVRGSSRQDIRERARSWIDLSRR